MAKNVMHIGFGSKHALKEANAIPAKYVFLDIVRFTQNRTIEAQSDIITALNDIVHRTLKRYNITQNKRYLLPTGDGICIALLNIEIPYDIHIQIAIMILKEVKDHNEVQKDSLRAFEVRIGLNANTDNIVTDINGNLNVAGAGINVAQRVMSLGDGNQIIVSSAVHETLRFREKYFNAFKEYHATVKHGDQMPVYQLVINDMEGLNTTIPSQFAIDEADESIPKLVAFFMAHSIILNSFFKSLSLSNDDINAGMIWLFLRAKDSYNEDSASAVDKHQKLTFKAGSSDLRAQYYYYTKLDNRVRDQLVDLFKDGYLKSVGKYFETNGMGEPDYRYVSDSGYSKLCSEWPEIVGAFKLKAHRK